MESHDSSNSNHTDSTKVKVVFNFRNSLFWVFFTSKLQQGVLHIYIKVKKYVTHKITKYGCHMTSIVALAVNMYVILFLFTFV